MHKKTFKISTYPGKQIFLHIQDKKVSEFMVGLFQFVKIRYKIIFQEAITIMKNLKFSYTF